MLHITPNTDHFHSTSLQIHFHQNVNIFTILMLKLKWLRELGSRDLATGSGLLRDLPA